MVASAFAGSGESGPLPKLAWYCIPAALRCSAGSAAPPLPSPESGGGGKGNIVVVHRRPGSRFAATAKPTKARTHRCTSIRIPLNEARKRARGAPTLASRSSTSAVAFSSSDSLPSSALRASDSSESHSTRRASALDSSCCRPAPAASALDSAACRRGGGGGGGGGPALP